MNVRMIVTDLDGTLFQPDKTVTPRALRALTAARDAGIVVMAATGRSIMDVAHLLPGVLRDLAVCSNGAVVYSARLDRVLLSRPIEPVVIKAFVETLQALAPQISFATLVNNGYDMLPGPGYLDLMVEGNHGRSKQTMTEVGLAELVSQPAVKLVARSSELRLAEVFDLCQQAAHVGVQPTMSGVPFVEISAAAVSKATTLDLLAADRGISRHEVVVLGDSLNDAEMIQWAGLGVAMANADPAVQELADEVAPANTEDGVAVVIEGLLGL